MTNKSVYLLSNEKSEQAAVKLILCGEGYAVSAFDDELSVIMAIYETVPDMLIIDICSPEMDENALCSSVRWKSGIPIIIVSASNTETAIIEGLNSGCDDYLIKPCSPDMLLCRVKCLLRRIELDKALEFPCNITQISDISLDTFNKQVFFGDRRIFLTAMEFSLLLYLSENKDRSVSRRELLDKVWGFESAVETRATDDMIKRIRRKLRDAGSVLKIETVWGIGYKIL